MKALPTLQKEASDDETRAGVRGSSRKVAELLSENLEQEKEALTLMKAIAKRLATDSAKAAKAVA